MPEDFNNFPRTATQLHNAMKKVVKKVAFDVQKDAQTLSPVDTGFLRASIYTQTATSSNYGQGKVSHPNVAKAVYQTLLPEIEPPEDSYTAHVAVGAEYGIYVEFGTVHGPSQPYFYPAVDQGYIVLDEVLRLVASALGGSSDVTLNVEEE